MFSIIIPVYNVAPFLGACLESVLGQSYQDWEAICIDDGSTDKSGEILEEYANRDSRIKVIHQHNSGVGMARNAGLAKSAGEWVAFLDADDVWGKDLLNRCNHIIQNSKDVDLIGFEHTAVDEVAKSIEGSTRCEEYFGDDVFRTVTPFFWSRIYRCDLIDGVKFEKYALGEDVLFLTNAILRAKHVVLINEKLYGYRTRAGSAVNSPMSGRKVLDMIGYLVDVVRAYRDSGRVVPKPVYRIYMNGLTEAFAFEYFKVSKRDRRDIKIKWLKEVEVNLFINAFQKMRAWALHTLPFEMSLYLFCYIPFKLKSKGFHR